MPLTAADIMTSPVVTVTPATSLQEIARVLTEKRITAVPVCNAGHVLVGIVSEADVLRPFRESIRTRRDWWLGLIAEGEELPQDFLDYIRQDHRTAADVMVRNVITGDEQMTIPQIAELAMKHGIKRLPILRDGKLVGVVSRSDLVAALARAPAMLI